MENENLGQSGIIHSVALDHFESPQAIVHVIPMREASLRKISASELSVAKFEPKWPREKSSFLILMWLSASHWASGGKETWFLFY